MVKSEINSFKETNILVKNKLRELEDRSRRNNLRVDGIHEHMNETWSDTESKILQMFKNRLGIQESIHIERAHRVGKSNNDKPRTIVLKLLDYKQKELILKNASKLKDTKIFINEDFCRETMQIRKTLRDEMLQKRAEGYYCVISYDRLIVKPLKEKRYPTN